MNCLASLGRILWRPVAVTYSKAPEFLFALRLGRTMSVDVIILGGCGRVGLPLAGVLADEGLSVLAIDSDTTRVRAVAEGGSPYSECWDLLSRDTVKRKLRAVCPGQIPRHLASQWLVMATGGEDVLIADDLRRLTNQYDDLLRRTSCLIIRSTVAVGTTHAIAKDLAVSYPEMALAYCPDRCAEGSAPKELRELPQLIGADDRAGAAAARILFGKVSPSQILLEPNEAELAKLVTNAWRYIACATANDLYACCVQRGFNFRRVHEAITTDYDRGMCFIPPRFTAGPCLPKDSVALSAMLPESLVLQSAIRVNSSLVDRMIEILADSYELTGLCVAVLGVTFKPNCDDLRNSDGWRFAKALRDKCSEVLISDPLATFEGNTPLDEVARRANLAVVATPHAAYTKLELPIPVVRLWELTK